MRPAILGPDAFGSCGGGAAGHCAGAGHPPEGGAEEHALHLRGGVYGHLLPPPQSGVLLCHSRGRETCAWAALAYSKHFIDLLK